ncbi:MAG TPA: alpha-1,4-glucan--maltose-1-phosphate maltosyltransferase [Gammaproteobacteria bacterium]|nr:alpha-1,4-glucan--maltose-1-phosphate maltosyltransferase [Gammaproteobacteria bacterium]
MSTAPAPAFAAPRAAQSDGRVRTAIENVSPQIDGGRFPIKRVVGEAVGVEADVFADGHDCIAVQLLYRRQDAPRWQATPMRGLGHDRWQASFTPDALGRWLYAVRAWVDHFETWRRDLLKRHAAGQDLEIEWRRGAALVEAAAQRREAAPLADFARRLRDQRLTVEARLAVAADPRLAALMRARPAAHAIARSARVYAVVVDVPRAGHSSWYEMFPRSASPDPGRHGNFRDVIARLPYVAGMGFDVLYLPPIHPIGLRHRKGPNNTVEAGPDDPGSPWAIGSAEGGHKAIHPALGTHEDFRRLLEQARALGIEVALDLAFQCSPDHPYVTEHPAWFLHRPDGSIRFAENPPKQYQDIYPFDFESEAWRALWEELRSVVAFWIAEGVRIFRVDNPHTKPFGFWEWLIADLKREHPELIFLSEAFTRPKVMQRLAKLGFTQSYTYFTWRTGKRELTEYFTALTRGETAEYFRPNLWPNTPDILPEHLQYSGRAGFLLRVTLAATLGANYGLYGPAFELMEHTARAPGTEEYLDSEKYQQRHWDLERADTLCAYIAHLNRVRREHPALQSDRSLVFHAIDNEALLCYSKCAPAREDCVLCVVNLDVHHPQTGWLELDLEALGIAADAPFQAHDLLSGARYLWRGARNFVAIDPAQGPAHVFALRRHVRREQDFDYFL